MMKLARTSYNSRCIRSHFEMGTILVHVPVCACACGSTSTYSTWRLPNFTTEAKMLTMIEALAGAPNRAGP